MMLWYKKITVFIAAGVVYLIGQYFRGMWFVDTNFPNICRSYIQSGKTYCNSPYLDTLGWPLIDLGQMLGVVAIILLAANAETFRKWVKFSLYYIPIVVLLDILIYPSINIGLGFLSGYQPTNYFLGVYPFGKLYVILTLGIVVWGLFTSHRKRT
ncbi:hypothetical protein A3G63_01495 [Candidatus Kaiserbacteria bacterium RIFCSPLOWO2_12_FULL_52_8]|uniref:Uncharacterized protein n=1 Tax=Candidatus Kaiserbacteria bacterium RIFCSPHIGHO2_01_FULL_53_31 TaxID=1798481 RepID=A0A1F6CHN2_9BACT|nr:MAG: hypothetical protein A2678_03255 [Candidatus Kaiserbacteria bacterium RIFCSPHIGHO2_01_FULL_53_31]OGG93458.1 MAG: hypothetical protein A3G63_01495 [Candidatus Kaiserbacteria bacterium RIFCSPLOWO2_12_FULL_52_8]